MDNSQWPQKPTFSPDGRYIVYDLAQTEDSPNHDIYVFDTTLRETVPLIEHPAHDFVLGWVPDGKRILFASDRTGNVDVWLIEVAEGKPKGQPLFIKRDIGRIGPIGFTHNGAFYYSVQTGLMEVSVSALDPTTGKLLGEPRGISQAYVGFVRSREVLPASTGPLLEYAHNPKAAVVFYRRKSIGARRQMRTKNLLSSVQEQGPRTRK